MKHTLARDKLRPDLLADVERMSGEDVRNCYQCGKCSAGCPITADMDVPPNQVTRLLQLGLVDAALRTKTIWLCASCETCTTRCPREVDLASIMDSLRHIALDRGILVPEIDIPFFNSTFLGLVKRYGRVYEMELIGRFNTLTFNFFKDVTKGPVLFLKGRLKLLPNLKGRGTAKRVFDQVKKMKSTAPALSEEAESGGHHT